MDTFGPKNLKSLLAPHPFPCVSIYLPTHHTLHSREEDPIRLKNLLGQADRLLIDRGLRTPEAKDLLAQPRALVTDGSYWLESAAGLAIFLSPAGMTTFRLPLAFDELVVVGTRFQVVPLLPLLSGECRFFVLAVSQKHVHLYQGDRRGLRALHVENLPENLAETLVDHRSEGTRQHHTVTPSRRGKSAAVFHGQGAATDEAKEELLLYFREVDRALRKYLSASQIPLVFAGVDYLFPIYRRASSYPNLLEQHVSGSPDLLTPPELHQRVWPLIEPFAERSRYELYARHQRLLHTLRLNRELREVLPLSHEGRVESLIVAARAQKWGVFDPVRRVVRIDEGSCPGNEELLNLCVVSALMHECTVVADDVPHLPGGEIVSAELRAAPVTNMRSDLDDGHEVNYRKW